MKAKELRDAVLQLAVQGKLVPQDKNDEPASELLKRIKTEKEQLIKEKKIKKQKALSSITEDEIPFDIPDSWEWSYFSDIVYYHMGKTPPRKENIYWDSPNYHWVSIADLQANTLTKSTKEFVNEYAYENIFKNKISKKGTLLMSFKLTVGKVSILDIDAFHNEAIISVFPFIDENKVTRNYLFKVLPLLAIQGKTKKAIKGFTLNSDSINRLYIPLPPLFEQQRIVDKLEQIMPLIDQYEVLENELSQLEKEFPENLKKSILQYAVQGKLVEQDKNDEPASELLKRIAVEKEQLIKEKKIKKPKKLEPITVDEIPFDIPDSWEWVRLGEVSNYGLKESIKPLMIDNDTWVLELEDIEKNSSVLLKKEYNLTRQVKSTKNKFYSGDLLYGKLRPYLNKMIIADEFGVCTTEIMPFKLYQRSNMKYVSFFLKAPYTNYTINNITHGMDMPRLGTENARNLCFPLPPMAEQQRIVNKIEELFKLCSVIENEKELKTYHSKY
jgi:type I restriction enzyme S subunit